MGKELTFAADEDKKNHERMQALIDQLQGKVKSYKKQIEEAEEIAALNLAKYRKVAGALGDAEASADANEQAMAMRKARAKSASLGLQTDQLTLQPLRSQPMLYWDSYEAVSVIHYILYMPPTVIILLINVYIT